MKAIHGLPKNILYKPGIRLFWKILFWFWLSVAAVITINLFVLYLGSDQVRIQPMPPFAERDLEHLKRGLEKRLKKDYPIHRRGGRRGEAIRLLTADGQSYSHKKVPRMLSLLHEKVLEERRPLAAFKKQNSWFGGVKVAIGEKVYYLYTFRPNPLLDRRVVGSFFRDQARGLLISIFLVSFPLCFLLTLIFLKPIRQLQHAIADLKINMTHRNKLQLLQRRGDEFGELARDIDALAAHIERLLKSQKQLIRDVSHELRSPLTRMQIGLGIARQITTKIHRVGQHSDSVQNKDVKVQDDATNSEDLESDIEPALARIEKEMKLMESMLEKILLMSQIDAGEVAFSKEPFKLVDILKPLVKDAQFEADQKDIMIKLEVDPTITLEGDKSLMMSGIENILRNAIRYANKEIQLRIYRGSSGQICLSVEDDGPGVADDQLDKLFNDFYRPQADRASESGGVGLGLSIAKRAFALNGGTIRAINRQQGGLKVWVEFAPIH